MAAGRHRFDALVSRLSGADPGFIRAAAAARATVAAACAWLTLRGIAALVSSEQHVTATLFGPVVCLIGALVIGPAQRLDRVITIAWLPPLRRSLLLSPASWPASAGCS